MIGLATVATLAGTPAQAACLSAEVWYRTFGGPKQYVLGPKHCVVPTPWPEGAGSGPVQVVVLGTGAGGEVWVPRP